METLAIDHSGTAEAWQSIPSNGQPKGDEGKISAIKSETL